MDIQQTACDFLFLIFVRVQCCHCRSILQSAMRRLQVEERALAEDRENLAEFVRTDAVTFGGEKRIAQ